MQIELELAVGDAAARFVAVQAQAAAVDFRQARENFQRVGQPFLPQRVFETKRIECAFERHRIGRRQQDGADAVAF